MGGLVAGACPDCGLSRHLALGGGFMDFVRTAAVPAGCVTCHQMVIVNAMDPEPRHCPTEGCTGMPEIIGELGVLSGVWDDQTVFMWLVDDATETEYRLRRTGYPCPNCGGSRLAFQDEDSWD